MKLAERSHSREQINIRASSRQRVLIDQAAAAVGKSRSEFMLEAACREAEDALLDRALFLVDDEAFDRFNALIDEPPAPSDALRELLRKPAPWE